MIRATWRSKDCCYQSPGLNPDRANLHHRYVFPPFILLEEGNTRSGPGPEDGCDKLVFWWHRISLHLARGGVQFNGLCTVWTQPWDMTLSKVDRAVCLAVLIFPKWHRSNLLSISSPFSFVAFQPTCCLPVITCGSTGVENRSTARRHFSCLENVPKATQSF